jgi:catechol 2,3-dioxygenase-like lactoylglutathione lyase family enzyme
MSARLAYVNILARDIDALSRFYSDVLGFAEIETHRSPIYRCLDANGLEFGFNAPLAYELLNIAPPGDARAGVATYITFEMGSEEALESALQQAIKLGARVLKPPYDTYYNARQCVLEDPEGNVFRLNYRRGQRAPADTVKNPPWSGRI